MLKLMTLEDVIRDTLQSRTEIKSNIERLLSLPNTTEYTRKISEANETISQTQSTLQSERKHLQTGTIPSLTSSNKSPQKTVKSAQINTTSQGSNA
jgi:hypothetical protein